MDTVNEVVRDLDPRDADSDDDGTNDGDETVDEAGAPVVQGAPECTVFPDDNVWNVKVDGLGVAGNSATLINTIGAGRSFHMDFGSYAGYGIPYQVVDGTTTRRTVVFDYDDESDAGPYPIPAFPLIEDGSGRPESATRGYRIDLDLEEGAPLLTIYGGKITSYRHVAEHAVDDLAKHIPALSGKCWTAKAPLPGGDFATDGAGALKAEYKLAYPFLTAATVDRIVKAYGTDARRWLGEADGWDALGGEIAHGLSAAEAEWMLEREWARDIEDILWRRSKLGLLFGEEDVAKLATWLDARRPLAPPA